MRFEQYLTELFKEKRDFDIVMEEDDTLEVRFSVNSIPFKFVADGNDYYGEIVFENMSADFQGSMDILGTMKEGALEVFSYIVSITRYFLKEYTPEKAVIEGFRSEQVELYKKIIKKFSREIEKMGYDVKITPIDIILRVKG